MTITEMYNEIERLAAPTYLRIPMGIREAQKSMNPKRMDGAIEYLKKVHESYRSKVRIGVPYPRDYDRTGKGDYPRITCEMIENYYE